MLRTFAPCTKRREAFGTHYFPEEALTFLFRLELFLLDFFFLLFTYLYIMQKKKYVSITFCSGDIRPNRQQAYIGRYQYCSSASFISQAQQWLTLHPGVAIVPKDKGPKNIRRYWHWLILFSWLYRPGPKKWPFVWEQTSYIWYS